MERFNQSSNIIWVSHYSSPYLGIPPCLHAWGAVWTQKVDAIATVGPTLVDCGMLESKLRTESQPSSFPFFPMKHGTIFDSIFSSCGSHATCHASLVLLTKFWRDALGWKSSCRNHALDPQVVSMDPILSLIGLQIKLLATLLPGTSWGS